MNRFLGAVLILCGLAGAAGAQTLSATERLEAFTAGLHTLKARFVQTLKDADGNSVQESTGTVVLRRPGQFRWNYRTPYEQQIVADGRKLWTYDTELEQVTVKGLDNALGSAPIMLLSERRSLGKDFALRDLASRDGLQWVELTPRVRDTDFTLITLGIDVEGMKVMHLQDSFGQATEIRFLDLEVNRAVADETFVFIPPADVDIIGNP